MRICPLRPADRERPLLLVVDGSYAIFRSFFAIRGMTGPEGNPTGAIYGLVRQMRQLLDAFAPDYFAVAFDENDADFRREIDPTYKANRGETPPDLAEQWPIAREFLAEMGLCTIAHGRFEADDLLATLAREGYRRGMDVVVSSGDKDLGQVVVDGTPSVVQHDPIKGLMLDAAAIYQRWGVAPSQVPDVQALAGDSIDNVTGVPGIGIKTATKLIAAHGSLQGLYEALASVQPPRIAGLLREHRDSAERALRLVTLDAQIDLATIAAAAGVPNATRNDGDHANEDLGWMVPRSVASEALAIRCEQLGFKGFYREFS